MSPASLLEGIQGKDQKEESFVLEIHKEKKIHRPFSGCYGIVQSLVNVDHFRRLHDRITVSFAIEQRQTEHGSKMVNKGKRIWVAGVRFEMAQQTETKKLLKIEYGVNASKPT